MTIQLSRTQVFLSVVFVLHFFFFFNNYFLLISGETTQGEVSHYETTGRRGRYTRAIIYFDYGNFTYRFSGNINVKYSSSEVTILFDPNDPTNAYEYSFFGFYFERLLYLVLLCLVFILPLIITKIKKNRYLIIDLKKFTFTIGKNRWDNEELTKANEYIEKISTPAFLSASESLYLKSPKLSSSEELTQIIIQELCLKEHIQIKHEWIRLTFSDRRTHLRPFFNIHPTIDKNQISETYNAVLKIFKTKTSLRNHELYQRLKFLYGLEMEGLRDNYFINELKKCNYINENNQPTLEVKLQVDFIFDLLQFIDNNISALIHEVPDKLGQLLFFLQTNILLLRRDTLSELRKFSKELASKIPDTLVNQLPRYFQNYNLFAPISLLSDSINFESSYSLISFEGGEFGGGGAGDSW